MDKLLVILGPTSTGKTSLALKLAQKFSGEIVSCDSRQVYKALDIGSNKFTGHEVKSKQGDSSWLVEGVPIHLYDLADPKVQFTVKDYLEEALKVVKGIHSRGKLPIITAGTGLYLKALLQGFSNLSIPTDHKLRAKLEKLSLEKLQQNLQEKDQDRWNNLNNSERNNKRRLLRHLELINMNPYTHEKDLDLGHPQWDVLKIGLTAPRSVLYTKTDERCLLWLDQGIIKEVENLSKKGVEEDRWKEIGLHYNLIYQFIKKKSSFEELVSKMQIELRRYVKRQLTWFKKEQNIEWFDITEKDWERQVETQVRSWYDAGRK